MRGNTIKLFPLTRRLKGRKRPAQEPKVCSLQALGGFGTKEAEPSIASLPVHTPLLQE